jgi:hypothetical protein
MADISWRFTKDRHLEKHPADIALSNHVIVSEILRHTFGKNRFHHNDDDTKQYRELMFVNSTFCYEVIRALYERCCFRISDACFEAFTDRIMQKGIIKQVRWLNTHVKTFDQWKALTLYSNLKTLELFVDSCDDHLGRELCFKDQRMLQRLEVCINNQSRSTEWLCSYISKCANLKDLLITSFYDDNVNLGELRLAPLKLKRLMISYINLSPRFMESLRKCKELKEIRITNISNRNLSILAELLPDLNLQTLELTPMNDNISMQSIISRKLPHLEFLVLHNALSWNDCRHVLELCPNLTRLSIRLFDEDLEIILKKILEFKREVEESGKVFKIKFWLSDSWGGYSCYLPQVIKKLKLTRKDLEFIENSNYLQDLSSSI